MNAQLLRIYGHMNGFYGCLAVRKYFYFFLRRDNMCVIVERCLLI